MFNRHSKAIGRIITAAAIGLSPIAALALDSSTVALASSRALPSMVHQLPRAAVSYIFMTLDNQADPTFNQLLGINNFNNIVGYYGIGTAGHPFRGYKLIPPYAQSNYQNENFPGAIATQVTALNNRRDTAGFWVDANNNNFGFIQWNGVFSSYKNPNTGGGTVNQLLGLNDKGIAVGFYTDATTINHAYELNQATGKFSAVVPPGGNNATATGINNSGDVTGFFTASNGVVVGFLRKGNTFSEFAFPNATATTPFGVNNHDEIVGSYLDSANASHGFTLTNPLTHAQFNTVDDPAGIGTTVINGLNDAGDLVGFYTDGVTHVDGFVAAAR